MAWRISSSASDASPISPLRTPRERAWPSPTILSALSVESSPTTAQTLEVPTSNPTMIEEEGSNMFLFGAQGFWGFGSDWGNQARFEPGHRKVLPAGEIERAD